MSEEPKHKGGPRGRAHEQPPRERPQPAPLPGTPQNPATQRPDLEADDAAKPTKGAAPRADD